MVKNIPSETSPAELHSVIKQFILHEPRSWILTRLQLNTVFRSHLQLLPNLYHLGAASRKELNGSGLSPIQEKLDSMAGEVAQVMDEQLQVT